MTNGAKKSAKNQSPSNPASELVNALEEDEFFLVYQPTIDLQTNAFTGVEALIRWRHPVRGIVSPQEFLAELERTGQIVPVGRWALRTACAQGAAWHEKGYRFAVSVNISVRQFDNTSFGHDVDEALSTSLFEPSHLVLEFPFSILRGADKTVASRFEQLRSLGVRLAIDDLRPSDSAFATLEEYPLSVLKLDRQFIADLADSKTSESLVVRLVQIAKSRNLQIIASGIEDVEQRMRLQHDEVNSGQGFLFSEPHVAADIDRFLENFSIFSGKPL